MNCPKCGNSLKPGSAFCSYCGAQFNMPERKNTGAWVTGIVAAVVALAAVITLLFVAPKMAGQSTFAFGNQIAGTWQLTSYENEMGKTDMTASNVQYTFFDNGTLNTSEGNVSTTQGAHWEWVDQNTIEISFENGDVILGITFGQTDGKDSFTAAVTNPIDPNKFEILTFVEADAAQSTGADGGGQGTQTTQGAQQDTNGISNGVDISNMSLQQLQGEWRGTGILTSLENIEKYVWNWEVLSTEEAALYNSMIGVANTCYFTIDQDNDVGCELFAGDTYWRGLAVFGTGTTLVNGELSASDETIERYENQIHATLSVDTDGILMLTGTVDSVIYEGPLGGPFDEVTYSFTFSVKKYD